MIRLSSLLHVLGIILGILAAAMSAPLACAIAWGEDPRPMGLAFGMTAATAAAFFRLFPRPQTELSLREAFLMVGLTWSSVALFGCLPYVLSPFIPELGDAFFESLSGFTTTGASILRDIEALPANLLFWRSLTHWLGGLGILMLMIAVLPVVGLGGMQLYRAQFGGAPSEKLHPRVIETAQSLWLIYVALTLAEYVLLRLAGMSPFDAINHAFATLATGGFSTRNASVAAFQSPLIEYIIIAFMLLASYNFARQYSLWVERRPKAFFLDAEILFHTGLIAVATLVISASLAWQQGYGPEQAFRSGLFQVVSIITCTGFATDDFEKWSPFAQFLLLSLMYVGGNVGSTSGGLKTYRIVLLFRVVSREFKQMIERRAVFAVRVGDQVIPEATIRGLLNLVYLVLLFNIALCLAVTATGVDVLTAISAVATTMFNVGPGLGTVGPAENFAHLPAAAKWFLCVSMISGRLEFYSFLVLFTSAFWRR